MRWIYLPALLLTASLLPAGSRGDAVGLFDGVGPMARRSDAVLLVRIDEHVETPSLVRGLLPNTGSDWYVEECTVLKVFQGGAREDGRLRLRLFLPGATADSGGFGIGTHHVVFLTRADPPQNSVRYQALKYENSHIQVSPDCDTRRIDGKSLAQSIRILAAEYRQYLAAKAKRENAFLAKLLK